MSLSPAPLPTSLYDDDFFAWTEQQAKLLRALKSPPAGMDIGNIAEEIESLGRSDLRAVESFLRNILVHLLKTASDPRARSVAHWRTESLVFGFELRQHYSPSMRQRIDINRIWQDALDIATLALREHDTALLSGLPKTCPFLVDDLLARSFDLDVTAQRLKHFSKIGSSGPEDS